MGCHGSRGLGYAGVFRGGGAGPAGLDPVYLAKQLRDFRDQVRTNDHNGVMQAVAADLSDDDAAALAAYAAGLR